MTRPAKPRHVRVRTVVALGLLPVTIGVQWLCARAPETVERLYSRLVFPPIAAALAWVSSRLPFSLTEVGVAGAGAILVLVLFRAGGAFLRERGHRWQVLGRSAVVVLFVAGVAYALFLLTWGLNYRRRAFGQSAGLEVRPSDRAELVGLSTSLIDAANSLREGLPEDEHGAMRLEARRSPAVKRDLAALARWVARYRGPATTAFSRVNDAHLRIQGQQGGARSYGRMVDLLLAEWRAGTD